VKSAPANSSYRECTRWCTPVTITPAGTITAVPISRPTYFRDCELEAGAVTVTRDGARRRAMIGARDGAAGFTSAGRWRWPSTSPSGCRCRRPSRS